MTSRKSPLELAALATAAVPGMRVTALRPPTYSDELSALEATSGILDRLGQAHDHDYIPFDVPRLAGQVKTSGGGTVYVHRDPGGTAPTDEDLETDPLLPASLGRALAALHNLPETVFSSIGLPTYTAIECRDRSLALLDEAAREVAIPAALWSRWEAALEDVSLWRFPSAPIHGDIQERCLSVKRGSLLAIGGWTSAHVGDPALDIAWVQATASDAFLDRFRETYGHERRATDLHVFTRAQLMSEIALVRWLVHGLHAEDASVIDEARAMLDDLAKDLDGEPLLPSHASAMGARISLTPVESPSASPIEASEPTPSAADHADEDDSNEPTVPVSRPASALTRKLAEGEVDPAAPTERLSLSPDGTLAR